MGKLKADFLDIVDKYEKFSKEIHYYRLEIMKLIIKMANPYLPKSPERSYTFLISRVS